MKSVPLSLSSYFFPEVKILTGPEFTHPDNPTFPHIPEEFNSEFGGSYNEEQAKHSLTLTLSIENKNHTFPYDIKLQVFGVVELLDDSLEVERRFKFCVENGLSLLYSSAREYILFLTSRAPHGPVSLPVVAFVGDSAQLQKAEDET